MNLSAAGRVVATAVMTRASLDPVEAATYQIWYTTDLARRIRNPRGRNSRYIFL
ncbi:MAG: hypothetical protein IPK53_20290 [bacterium]|nr:hypothetical protein [bacterium]